MKTILAALGGLAALAIVFAGTASSVGADDADASFRVHNDLDQTVGVWVASEKNTSPNPWSHVVVEPGKDATIILHSPDRFVISVNIGNSRSRTKPVALKAFLAAHPEYALDVLKLNLGHSWGTDFNSFTRADAAEPERKPTGFRFDFRATKPSGDNAKEPAAKAPPVKVPDLAFRDDDGKIWFRVHNGLDQDIRVWAASEKSSHPDNPWFHEDVAPDKTASVSLVAPDRYTLAVEIGKRRFRSKPVALKEFMDAHPHDLLEVDLDRTPGAQPSALPKYRIDFLSAIFFVPPAPDDNTAKQPNADQPKAETLPFDFQSEPVLENNGQ